MYKIQKFIHSTAEQLEIIPTGDWHYGSPNCKIDKVKDLLNYVSSNPDCRLILMGDLWNSILPKDKRYNPDQEFEMIDEQYDYLKNLLLPIKDKILCALTGNHEWKLHSEGYGDLTKRLCKELGISYGGFSSFIKLLIKPKTHHKGLTIFAHHGWTASRKTGAVINAVENLSQYYQADVYLVGHSHKLSSTKQTKISWGGARDVLFCNTGTYLQTATLGQTSYSERAGYPPLRIGCLKIKWYPRQEKFYVTE